MDVNTLISQIGTYGALGLVCAYFMIKDWAVNKAVNDTLSSLDKSFALLVQVLQGSKGDEK
jgi:hypothetical protein